MPFSDYKDNFKKTLFERRETDTSTSAKIISFYKNKILLLKNKDNTYELPGGHLTIGELPLNGAKREFYEETGLKIDRLKLYIKKKNRLIYVTHLLTNNVKISKEHKSFIFVSPPQIKKINLSIKANKDLRYIINNNIKKDEDIQDIL
tara:strand:- start:68 stop:511 length:444 start_codon:yes stop_codon:yes gene_type:complete